MVRFTKKGTLDGEPNLVLPPLTERTITVRWRVGGWVGVQRVQ